MDDQREEKCLKCGTPLENYTPVFCCNGRECGCMGNPIEPPLCDKCWDEVMG